MEASLPRAQAAQSPGRPQWHPQEEFLHKTLADERPDHRDTETNASARGRSTQDHPLGVVAQDDAGIAVELVDQNLFVLAERLGVPSLTFTGWLQGVQSQLNPYFIRTSAGVETIAVNDPRWLQRLTAPGLADTVHYGPIEEEAGDATTVAKVIASRLAHPGHSR